jgi:hypothetical protein
LKLWDKWVTLPSGKHINTGIKPRPFIKPAWDAKQNAVLTKMEQVIKTEIEKIR